MSLSAFAEMLERLVFSPGTQRQTRAHLLILSQARDQGTDTEKRLIRGWQHGSSLLDSFHDCF